MEWRCRGVVLGIIVALGVAVVGLVLAGPPVALAASQSITCTTGILDETTFQGYLTAGGTITYSGSGPCTVHLTTSLTITAGQTITVDGGSGGLILDGETSDQQPGAFVLIAISDTTGQPAQLTLKHVTLENGQSGIVDSDNRATVELDQSTIQHLSASGAQAGSLGIAAGKVTLTGSTVSDISVTGTGQAVNGGISAVEAVTLTDSTITGITASNSGSGITLSNGIASTGGAVTLTNSGIKNVNASNTSGGASTVSDGIVGKGSVSLTGNSTISGISAGGGDGNASYGIQTVGNVSFTSSSVSGVSASGGGANVTHGIMTGGTVSLASKSSVKGVSSKATSGSGGNVSDGIVASGTVSLAGGSTISNVSASTNQSTGTTTSAGIDCLDGSNGHGEAALTGDSSVSGVSATGGAAVESRAIIATGTASLTGSSVSDVRTTSSGDSGGISTGILAPTVNLSDNSSVSDISGNDTGGGTSNAIIDSYGIEAATASLKHSTLSGIHASGTDTGGYGAVVGIGIVATGNGTITLISTTVSDVNAKGSGGDVWSYGIKGQVGSSATVVLASSTIEGIAAAGSNAQTFVISTGIEANGSGNGVTLTGSTISNVSANSATSSVNDSLGRSTSSVGISVSDAPVTLTDSTVSEVSASGSDSGYGSSTTTFGISGGGKVTLAQSTIKKIDATGGSTTGNSKGNETNTTGIGASGTVSLTSSTLSGVNATSGSVGGTIGGGIAANSFGINGSGEVSLSSSTLGDISITANDAATSAHGSGIMAGGAVTLTHSSLKHVVAAAGSGTGAAAQGSGIHGGDTVTLDFSTVGGVTVTGQGEGVGVSGDDEVMLTNSTVSGVAVSGQGVSIGISASEHEVLLASSTLSGVSISGLGASIGISSDQGAVTLVSSTISGAGISTNGAATLTSSTISDRGGSYAIEAAGPGAITLSSSIVSGAQYNCGGTVVDDGYNISASSDGNEDSCGFSGSKTSKNMTDAVLSLLKLGNYGGQLAGAPGEEQIVPTIALGPDSEAIDFVPSTFCGQLQDASGNSISTDERGVSRHQPEGGACDSGAYEAPAVTMELTPAIGPDPDTGWYNAATLGGQGKPLGVSASFSGLANGQTAACAGASFDGLPATAAKSNQPAEGMANLGDGIYTISCGVTQGTVLLGISANGVTMPLILKIDTTNPKITITTPTPTSYVLGAPVTADYSCDDTMPGSGLASCTGPVANGTTIDTSTLGSFTFTVKVADEAGNQASKTVTYSVSYEMQPLPGNTGTVHRGYYAVIRFAPEDANGRDYASRSLKVVSVELDGNGTTIPFAHQFQYGTFSGTKGYQLSINTRNLTPGAWTLVVQFGNGKDAPTSSITFTVK